MSKPICIALFLTLVIAFPASAEYRTLSWDDGTAASMEVQKTLAHCTLFFRQSDWDKTFSKTLQVYGQRYGDVGTHNISVVVFGPQSDKTIQFEDSPDSLVIHTSSQVRMAEFPESPGWVDIEMEVIDLPEYFWLGIFTRSHEEFGVKIGKTSIDNTPSYSSSAKPGNPDKEKTAKLSTWDDGGNWMIRLAVAPTPDDLTQITTEDLSGKKFTVSDDGLVDGYYTFQRGGPYLHIRNNYSKQVNRVYFYAHVQGDWYNTDRKAGVYLLDERRRIVARTQLPFGRFTGESSWNYVSFDGVAVPDEFYVLIEPFNRPEIELMLGYDSSGPNLSSDFGTVGVLYDWNLTIPKESTNWMIRVEYN